MKQTATIRNRYGKTVVTIERRSWLRVKGRQHMTTDEPTQADIEALSRELLEYTGNDEWQNALCWHAAFMIARLELAVLARKSSESR